MLKRLLLLLALLPATAVLADADLLGEARKLIESGQAGAAYDMLHAVEPERAGDAEFDYLYGVAALDSGHPVEAVFALERVVDLNPDNGPARGELARAYLALGETDDAQTEFKRVTEMDLPPEARQTIERYMSNISLFHDRTRTRFRNWIHVGVGYDTNVNGATSDKGPIAVPIAPGIPFLLGGTENSPIWRIGAGTRFTSPIDLDKGLSLFGRISLDHRLTVDEASFASTMGDGALGVRLERGKHKFSLAGEGNIVKIDGLANVRSDRDTAGLSTQWQYAVNDNNQVTTYAQYSIVRYPEQRVRDVNRFTGGVGWGHAFAGTTGTPILFGSVFGGTEDALDEGRGSHFGRDFYGFRAGASFRPRERHTLFTSFTLQMSDYDTPDPSFLRKRDDDFFNVEVGHRYQHDKNWSVSPTIRYTHNDSNIVITDYDRFEVMLLVRNDF